MFVRTDRSSLDICSIRNILITFITAKEAKHRHLWEYCTSSFIKWSKYNAKNSQATQRDYRNQRAQCTSHRLPLWAITHVTYFPVIHCSLYNRFQGTQGDFWSYNIWMSKQYQANKACVEERTNRTVKQNISNKPIPNELMSCMCTFSLEVSFYGC